MKYYLTEKTKRWLEDAMSERRAGTLREWEPTSLPLPVVATADVDISRLSDGPFTIMKQRPGGLVASSETRNAYTLCSVTAGDHVLLIYTGGPESLGYWLAITCAASEDTVQCTQSDTGTVPASVQYQYEVDHGTTALTGGVNYAMEGSGTYTASMSGCTGSYITAEHSNTTVWHTDPSTSQSYPPGTKTRSRFELALVLVDAVNAGWRLKHWRQMQNPTTNNWDDLSREAWFSWTGSGATTDPTVNRVLTLENPGFVDWIDSDSATYDVQVYP